MKRWLIAAALAAAIALRLLLPGSAAAVRALLLAPPVRQTAQEAFAAFSSGGSTEDVIAVFRQLGD